MQINGAWLTSSPRKAIWRGWPYTACPWWRSSIRPYPDRACPFGPIWLSLQLSTPLRGKSWPRSATPLVPRLSWSRSLGSRNYFSCTAHSIGRFRAIRWLFSSSEVLWHFRISIFRIHVPAPSKRQPHPSCCQRSHRSLHFHPSWHSCWSDGSSCLSDLRECKLQNRTWYMTPRRARLWEVWNRSRAPTAGCRTSFFL